MRWNPGTTWIGKDLETGKFKVGWKVYSTISPGFMVDISEEENMIPVAFLEGGDDLCKAIKRDLYSEGEPINSLMRDFLSKVFSGGYTFDGSLEAKLGTKNMRNLEVLLRFRSLKSSSEV